MEPTHIDQTPVHKICLQQLVSPCRWRELENKCRHEREETKRILQYTFVWTQIQIYYRLKYLSIMLEGHTQVVSATVRKTLVNEEQ